MFKKKQSNQPNKNKNNQLFYSQKFNTQLSQSNNKPSFNKNSNLKSSNSNLPYLNSSNKKQSYNKNQSYHKNQSYDRNQGYGQDYVYQDSVSQQSTFSFHEYKDILNNFFQNGQHDQQWNNIPQIMRLILKALSLSMNAIQKKILQNRQIINDQGLRIKQNNMNVDNVIKQIKKMNIKISDIQNNNNNNRSVYQQINNDNLRGLNRQHNISRQQYNDKGLDIIMIQQVKTITDAIISKKSIQIMNEVVEMNKKLQQGLINRIQQLKDRLQQQSVQKNIQYSQQIKQLIKQQYENMQTNIKQNLIIVDKQIQHLNKQLENQKQVISHFALYCQQKYITKSNIQQILKYKQSIYKNISNQHQLLLDNNNSKYGNNNNINNNNNNSKNNLNNNNNLLLLNRNKIQQIVKLQIQNNMFIKKKQFDQFKQKYHQLIISFPTLSEVQNIIHKSNTNKHYKQQQFNTIISKHNLINNDNQPTIQLKNHQYQSPKQNHNHNHNQNKSISVKQNNHKSKSKSPQLNKKINKNKSTKKITQSKLSSTNLSRKQSKNYKTTSYYQQTQQNSPIIQSKLTKSKTFKQSNAKTSSNQNQFQPQIQFNKFQTKIKAMILLIKDNLNKQFQQNNLTLQKKLIKRLQTAEQQFCSVVQQNWKQMTQKNISVQKKQKQNIQHLLHIFSILNVIARYTTVINFKAGECIKWSKQVFNAQNKAFYFNQGKTHLYVSSPGVYQVHVVLYTLNNPAICFGVELNSQQIYSNQNSNNKVKSLQNQHIDSPANNKNGSKHSKGSTSRKYSHSCRGVQFNQTLLIPAKSHIVVRLIQQMDGQGLIQIRKL